MRKYTHFISDRDYPCIFIYLFSTDFDWNLSKKKFPFPTTVLSNYFQDRLCGVSASMPGVGKKNEGIDRNTPLEIRKREMCL